jgi:hypothetical protein
MEDENKSILIQSSDVVGIFFNATAIGICSE